MNTEHFRTTIALIVVLNAIGPATMCAQQKGNESLDATSRRLSKYAQRLVPHRDLKLEVLRFSGFMEGVTSVRVPMWWEDQLYAMANGSTSASAPINGNVPVREPNSVDRRTRKVLIFDQETKNSYPFVLSNAKEYCRLKVIPAKNEFYIMEIIDISDTYRVFKYSKSRSEIEWTSEVRLPLQIGGMNFHSVDVVCDDMSNVIGVFGLFGDYVYAAGLEGMTGYVRWNFRFHRRSDPTAPLFGK